MELVATYPILYRSHQYEVGDSLPADDESMVQAWLDAGTAVWSEGKQEKAKATPATATAGLAGESKNGETPENVVGRVPKTPTRSKGAKRMVRKSFKEVMKDDVNNTFMNVDEFADMHTVDGKEIPVLVDDNEIIEREKKMKSNMDGVYVKQKLIYVKADDFGSLPAIGRQIVFDGKRYMVTDSTDEGGVYTITIEANRTK